MTTHVHKITPTELSARKVKLCAPMQAYRHESQTNESDLESILTVTFNATQTYDSNGKPKDRDNDK